MREHQKAELRNILSLLWEKKPLGAALAQNMKKQVISHPVHVQEEWHVDLSARIAFALAQRVNYINVNMILEKQIV